MGPACVADAKVLGVVTTVCVIAMCYVYTVIRPFDDVITAWRYSDHWRMSTKRLFAPPRIKSTFTSLHADWDLVPQSWINEMEARRRHLENACAAAEPPSNNSLVKASHNLYVDERHRLIICEIPKVGCSNFNRLLYGLSANIGIDEYENINGSQVHSFRMLRWLRKLDSFSDFGIQFRLKHYLKVIAVRHPFERIVSAYRSKLEGGDREFSATYGPAILKYERKKKTEEVIRHYNVSFAAFARYLTQISVQTNFHFKAYHEICFPCTVHYDVIARHETISRDVSMVLKMIHAAPGFHYPNSHRVKVHSEDVWKSYFKHMTKEEVWQFWDTQFETDGRLFNYTMPNDIGKS
ncbi:carbohydrate sulfotransferase 11 [Lingula anatina]|uniref:Carbohydrate sulfotransferase n=1 Tax=Lingula anatina TaxID=7574 RepID=A0A1S3HEE3_LINAN|nr:carbohydrate sulfotransferase 11 [Lingula anatina]|eukprot:XP_013384442.1 carbohydrate sulfotransferase 11 [Lingula anatina]